MSRDYGIIFLDEDKEAFEVVEKINDYLDVKYNNIHGERSRVLFDILDVDGDVYCCILNLNNWNGEDEVRIMDWIVECGKDLGVDVVFDDYPNIDEGSFLTYSYSATFTV